MDARALWGDVRSTDIPVRLALGPNTVDRFLLDPKRLGFYAARYKFAAKILSSCASVADVGCGDGFFSLGFCGGNRQVCGYDFDEALIEYAKTELVPAFKQARPADRAPVFQHLDILGSVEKLPTFGGICCCDVIEHVDPKRSLEFISALHSMLEPCGIAVIGTPNEYAAQYGSPHSALGHINNFSPERLRSECEMLFPTVIIAGANDELIHFGFEKLYHYVFAICVKPGFSYGRHR